MGVDVGQFFFCMIIFSSQKLCWIFFFVNISLHDFFSYGKRSSLCDLFGLMT